MIELVSASVNPTVFAKNETIQIAFTLKNVGNYTIDYFIVRLVAGSGAQVFAESTATIAKNASRTFTYTFAVADIFALAARTETPQLRVYWVDTANNSATQNLALSATMLDMRYAPSIPIFTVSRTPNADSTDAAVDLTCTLAEGADPEYEDLALTLKWKEEDAASFPAGNTLAVTVADALDAGGTTVTPSFTFETGKAYTLRATFTDGIDSAVSEAKLSKAFKVLNVHPTSKNIGEGQFAVADTSAGLVHDTMYRYRFGAGAEDADGREIIGKTDYSTDAVDTGVKWTDGKTIYRKVLTFTSMAVSTSKNVSLGETAIAEVVDLRGMFKPVGETARAPIPWAHYSSAANQFQMVLYGMGSNPYITLRTGSGQKCDSGFIVVEYTLPS